MIAVIDSRISAYGISDKLVTEHCKQRVQVMKQAKMFWACC